MNDTLRLDELIGWAGILANGSWACPLGPGGFPLLSTYPKPFDVLSWPCVEAHRVCGPSRRPAKLSRGGEWAREAGAEPRSCPSPSTPRSCGAKRRKRVRILLVSSSSNRATVLLMCTSSTTNVRSASTVRSCKSKDTRTSSSRAPNVNV